MEIKCWNLVPSNGKIEQGELPEINLTYDDNNRSGFFVAATYFPTVVDQTKMKESLQCLIDKNPELTYRFSASHTMSFVPSHSSVPFLVANKPDLKFDEINAKLSYDPNVMLRENNFRLMKEFVEANKLFVGNYHKYFGGGSSVLNVPAVAVQLTFDGVGGTWVTRWGMHNFGDGASHAKLFMDLISVYNSKEDEEVCVPRYSFIRHSGEVGWDSSAFPPLFQKLGRHHEKNSWARHMSSYSPVRKFPRIFKHKMGWLRFETQLGKSNMDEIKGKLQEKVSTGDIFAGLVWMAVSLSSQKKINACLVKDTRDSNAEAFSFGNFIDDILLGDSTSPLPRAGKKIPFSTMAEFIYSVKNGRIGSFADATMKKSTGPLPAPNLSISNLSKFDMADSASIAGVPIMADYGTWVMEHMPIFHVFAFIGKTRGGYWFAFCSPVKMKAALEKNMALLTETMRTDFALVPV